VSDPGGQRSILNTIGSCLMSLGRLEEAAPFFEQYVTGNIAAKDWANASIGYGNLAGLHAYLGALEASAEAAGEALALAHRAEDKWLERTSLAYQARAAHLRGDLEPAGAAFAEAEEAQQEIFPQVRYLNHLPGIMHADHLRRAGDPDRARRVTEANLWISERFGGSPDVLSRCHRVLGDLDADPSADSGRRDHESARAHYDRALEIARGITYRPALIEALLARGRWAARYGDLTGLQDPSGLAFGDLNEALGYAVDGGYRVYEADIRVALAWGYVAAGDRAAGRAQAERAGRMSEEMGYYWGGVDAEEVLEALG
jgi:tetratricopeptide (TPR) repeat protein